ncbi:BgTH12-02111 [Blumeria graminis f. sp. triticale]|uniref:BgTH12-02111 n=1 Tax=Blumeria graminis f. sp. triticale TaxID=1689686 RepID=A0A9W4CZP6_BLUGR|nr:BgTH12-02111 [Blumeria graminis f. sp. triticale]
MKFCDGCRRTILQISGGCMNIVSSTSPKSRHSALIFILEPPYFQKRGIRYSSRPVRKLITERIINRRTWLDSDEKKPVHDRNHIELHPAFSPRDDPLKLAEFVRRTLERDDFELAARVVRESSRKIQCVVSWNHLIDWLMKKGKIKTATKIHSEMKKRGQTPDAYTYTIILRGCSQHQHSKQALAKVLTIYQSMTLDKSPVKPNTIHTNAILKMCAASDDIETMLSIAADQPSSGPQASDAITFVTILNAIRHHAIGRLPMSPSTLQLKKNIREAVLQGLEIWNDVMRRWRKGDMWIDEELVCAIGRLLLLSEERQHWDQIISIIETTMAIPRQLPIYSNQIKAPLIHDTQSQTQSVQAPSLSISSSESQPQSSNGTPEVPITRVLSATTSLVDSKVGVYTKPGRNTLSLIMNALLLLSSKEPATRYWKFFTEQLSIEPDLENYVSYMRILRVFRSSTQTVELVQKMPQNFKVTKIFRIAMSSCARDKNNNNAFSSAGKILDMMQITLREPDIPTIARYMDVALSSSKYSASAPSSSNSTRSLTTVGKQILRALDRVEILILSLKNLMFFKDPDLMQKSESERDAFLGSFIALIQKAVGAHDVLIQGGLITSSLIPELTSRRFKLDSLRVRIMKRKRTEVSIIQSKGSSNNITSNRLHPNHNARYTRPLNKLGILPSNCYADKIGTMANRLVQGETYH